MFRKFWLVVLRVRDIKLRSKGDTSQSLESTKLYPILAQYPNKLIVDIGANDGFHLSNSYYFIKNGWNALLVEPIPNSLDKAKEIHSNNLNVFLKKLL